MSQSPPSPGIVATSQAQFVAICMNFAMTVFVAYEYLITIQQEVTTIWQRKWNFVTWIFISNRYLVFPVAILQASPATAQSCIPVMILNDLLSVSQFIIFAVFSALRVYAICNRHTLKTLLVLALGLVPVVTTTYLYTQATDSVFSSDPTLGTYCRSEIKIPATVYSYFALGNRISTIAAHVLVVVWTWKKTFMQCVEAARADLYNPLSSLLLRDGTFYFVALLVMNIGHMLLDTAHVSPVQTVNEVLTPVLISRFLLNLRQVNDHGNHVDVAPVAYHSDWSIPGFRFPPLQSIVGNMDQDLVHGPSENVPGEEPAVADIAADEPFECHFGENSSGIQLEEITRNVVV